MRGRERERERQGVDGVKGMERKMDKSTRVKREEVAHGQIHTSLRLPDKASKLDRSVYKNAFGASEVVGVAFLLAAISHRFRREQT